jgi:cytochrome P450
MAASQIPIAYAVISGNSTAWLKSLHDSYGSVVRVGPNELSYADAQSWRDIYGSHPTRRAGMPRDLAGFASMEEGTGVSSLVTASDADHMRMRSAYTHFFSNQALASQEPLIASYVDKFIARLHGAARQQVNMVDMFSFLFFDIIADFHFGESLHLLEEPTHVPWVKSQFGYIRSSQMLATLMDFPWVMMIFRLIPSGYIKNQRDAYFRFTNERLEQRLAMETDRPDIVHLAFYAPEKRILTKGELRANTPLFMFAGSDTTTTLLSGLIVLLGQHSTVMKRLTKEIRGAFQTSSDITMKKLRELEYLDACIKEAHRIYPPVPIPMPRVVPKPGAEISGRWVPAGTRVYSSPFSTQRSAANFHDPHAFHPERWLSDANACFSNDNKAAFQPFSLGPRSCLGQE